MSLKTRIKNLEAAVPAPEDKDEIERQRWFSEWQESQRREREANRAAWLAALPADVREDVESYEEILEQVRRADLDKEPDDIKRIHMLLSHGNNWETEANRRFEAAYGRPRREPHIAEHDWLTQHTFRKPRA